MITLPIAAYCPIDYHQSYIDRLLAQGLHIPERLKNSAIKRQCEFLAGRYCAIQAMRRLTINVNCQPAIGVANEPIWPQGLLGSISHTKHKAAALVTKAPFIGVGIDLENWITADKAAKIARRIINSREAQQHTLFPNFSYFLTLIFSAKESIFKIIYPTLQKFIGFSAVQLISCQPQLKQLNFCVTQNLSATLMKNATITAQYKAHSWGVETQSVLV